MGCYGCPENKSESTTYPQRLHPVLDRTELGLQAAWITEVRLEQKQLVTDLIHAVQALKNPYIVPLEAQLANLLEVSYMVGAMIPCGKCRVAWVQEVARKIQVRLLLEKGERGKAIWLWVRAEFWGKIWGLRALPLLFRRPHPELPQTAE